MDVLNPSDEKQFLFHYTSLEKALEKILPEPPRLRMGRFIDTKDPRENKNWNFKNMSSILSGSNLSGFELHHRVQAASLRVQADLRMACLTEDALLDEGETPAEIRGFGLSRMWDRYGGAHRGVCLAFDKNALGRAVSEAVSDQEKELERLFLPGPPTLWAQAVTYDILASRSAGWEINAEEAREIGSEDRVVQDHLATNYGRLLFLKSKDWEGEREFRYAYLGKSDNPDLYIPIEKTLRGIFLGVDFPDAYLPSVKAVCPMGVVLFKMEWQGGYFRTPMMV